jgi:tetratricopeptide (TPR) repeat protein
MCNKVSGVAVGNVVQAGTIGAVSFASAPPPVGVPRQLPSATPIFVNRTRELSVLDDLVRHSDAPPPIVVLTGMSGVGKSTLAIHWASANLPLFDGGQLFADLSAYRHRGLVDMNEVVGAFLRALGVHEHYLPVNFPERVTLFRTMTMAGRFLIMLDNADLPAQVRGLVPGAPGSVVLTTSRQRLSGLVMDGAKFVDVPPLTVNDSVSLVTRMVPDERTASEPAAVRNLAKLCAGLPIALCTAGAQLAQRKHRSVTHLVEHLSDDRERLSRLSIDETSGVERIFDITYADLPTTARRMYRLLGIHPGPEFGLAVAAVAAEISETAADETIGTLCAANLIEEPAPERFRFHDLVRLHARACAERDETAEDRENALRRIVDWYALGAAMADLAVLGAGRWRLAEADPVRWREDFDPASAMAWFDAERGNLLTAVRTAAENGWDETVWQLGESLWAFYHSRKHYPDWIEATRLGMTAAARCGHVEAGARMRNQLARAHIELGEFALAEKELRSAQQIASAHPRTQALALESLGLLRRAQGRCPEAAHAFAEARAVHERIGNARGVAVQAYQQGDALVRAQRVEEGLAVLEEALGVMKRLGDEMAVARVQIAQGTAYGLLHRDDDALNVLNSAVATTKRRCQPVKEAQALEALVALAERNNRATLFEESARRLFELYREGGNPRSTQVANWIKQGKRLPEDD